MAIVMDLKWSGVTPEQYDQAYRIFAPAYA